MYQSLFTLRKQNGGLRGRLPPQNRYLLSCQIVWTWLGSVAPPAGLPTCVLEYGMAGLLRPHRAYLLHSKLWRSSFPLPPLIWLAPQGPMAYSWPTEPHSQPVNSLLHSEKHDFISLSINCKTTSRKALLFSFPIENVIKISNRQFKSSRISNCLIQAACSVSCLPC